MTRQQSVGLAVGVDIVDVARLTRLLEEHPDGACDIFTAHELAYCSRKRNSYPHLAARFAAKEAFLKACGTGLRGRHRWTDIEVRNDPLGRPHLRLTGAPARIVRAHDAAVDVSLSHSGAYAIAHVSFLFAEERPASPAADDLTTREEPSCDFT